MRLAATPPTRPADLLSIPAVTGTKTRADELRKAMLLEHLGLDILISLPKLRQTGASTTVRGAIRL